MYHCWAQPLVLARCCRVLPQKRCCCIVLLFGVGDCGRFTVFPQTGTTAKRPPVLDERPFTLQNKTFPEKPLTLQRYDKRKRCGATCCSGAACPTTPKPTVAEVCFRRVLRFPDNCELFSGFSALRTIKPLVGCTGFSDSLPRWWAVFFLAAMYSAGSSGKAAFPEES